jgi:uncharacterized protein (TIGR00297 family)
MDQRKVIQAEDWRQLEHFVVIGFAFLLPYINLTTTLLLCVLAICHAVYFSPRWIRITTREGEQKAGVSVGKVLYAACVLVLILVFHDLIYIAAGAWAILAVGDSLSNVVGRRLGRKKLPYNLDKSYIGLLTFWIAGALAAWVLILWNLPQSTDFSPGRIFVFSALTALLCAIAESLPPVIDDNLAISWVGGASFAVLFSIQSPIPVPVMDWKLALSINVVPAILALLFRWISPRGVLLACLLGTVILLGLGLIAYLTICAFLLLGSLVTRLGLKMKTEQGLAEPNRGRRGVVNVISNGAVPCIIGLFGLWLHDSVMMIAYVAAVATAAFDTVATEIGQWLGRTTVNPASFRRVPAGTPGAISLEGTLAGFVAAVAICAVPFLTSALPLAGVIVLLASATAGALSESLIASWSKPKFVYAGEVLNFYNTLVGATIAAGLWTLFRLS